MASTAQDHREATEREYSVYVAKETIFIDSSRAFNIGDPVPVSHVEAGVVDVEQVEKTSTKAGRALAQPGSADEPKG